MLAPWLRTPGRAVLALLAAIFLVALSARLDLPVPGSPVPQSAQTLAVVVVGGVLGPALGAGALLGYLAVGAVGLPVFAGASGGWTHLTGPTAGYLVGFVAAAALMGWACARLPRGAARPRSATRLLGGAARIMGAAARIMGAAVAAHAVVLALGWARLAVSVGAGAAFTGGVAPFLWGGVGKSVVATAVLVGVGHAAGSAAVRDGGDVGIGGDSGGAPLDR